MRKCKRIIHKQFGGLGNFFAIIILVALTVVFINTYVLNKGTREWSMFTRSSSTIGSLSATDALPDGPEVLISKTESPAKAPEPVAPAEPEKSEKIQRPSTPDAGTTIGFVDLNRSIFF